MEFCAVIISIIIIIILILIVSMGVGYNERLDNGEPIRKPGYVKLYDWDTYYIDPMYNITESTRIELNINLRKIEFDLKNKDSGIIIYSYYEGTNVASIRGEFYNTYGDLPKMNPYKYQEVYKHIGPGIGVVDIAIPVKRIFAIIVV